MPRPIVRRSGKRGLAGVEGAKWAKLGGSGAAGSDSVNSAHLNVSLFYPYRLVHASCDEVLCSTTEIAPNRAFLIAGVVAAGPAAP